MKYLLIVSVMISLVSGSDSLRADTLTGQVSAPGARDNADSVVFIETVPGLTFDAPSENAVMDQENMVFIPRVLPVLVGTEVDFLNSDSVAHNVFTPDKCADEFDLGNWTRGESRSKRFSRPCAATILCFVHPGMEAFVVAVPTPFYAKTDASGSYEIDGIPAGTYTVKVWHPTHESQSVEVVIEGKTTLDFSLDR